LNGGASPWHEQAHARADDAHEKHMIEESRWEGRGQIGRSSIRAQPSVGLHTSASAELTAGGLARPKTIGDTATHRPAGAEVLRRKHRQRAEAQQQAILAPKHEREKTKQELLDEFVARGVGNKGQRPVLGRLAWPVLRTSNPLVRGTPYESTEEAKRRASLHGNARAVAWGDDHAAADPDQPAVWPRLEASLSPRLQAQPTNLSPPVVRRGGPHGYDALSLREVPSSALKRHAVRAGEQHMGMSVSVVPAGVAEASDSHTDAEAVEGASPRTGSSCSNASAASARRLSRATQRRGLASPRAATSSRAVRV